MGERVGHHCLRVTAAGATIIIAATAVGGGAEVKRWLAVIRALARVTLADVYSSSTI